MNNYKSDKLTNILKYIFIIIILVFICFYLWEYYSNYNKEGFAFKSIFNKNNTGGVKKISAIPSLINIGLLRTKIKNIRENVKPDGNNLENTGTIDPSDDIFKSHPDKISNTEIKNHFKSLHGEYSNIIINIRDTCSDIIDKFDNDKLNNNTRFNKLIKDFYENVVNFKERFAGIMFNDDEINIIGDNEPMLNSKVQAYLLYPFAIHNINNKIQYNIKIMDKMFPEHEIEIIDKLDKEIKKLNIIESQMNIFLTISVNKMNFECMDGLKCITTEEYDIEQQVKDELSKDIIYNENNQIFQNEIHKRNVSEIKAYNRNRNIRKLQFQKLKKKYIGAKHFIKQNLSNKLN